MGVTIPSQGTPQTASVSLLQAFLIFQVPNPELLQDQQVINVNMSLSSNAGPWEAALYWSFSCTSVLGPEVTQWLKAVPQSSEGERRVSKSRKAWPTVGHVCIGARGTLRMRDALSLFGS